MAGGPPPLEDGPILVGTWATATYFSPSYHILGEIISLESNLHKNRDLCQFCPLIYPQALEQCLAQRRCPRDIS